MVARKMPGLEPGHFRLWLEFIVEHGLFRPYFARRFAKARNRFTPFGIMLYRTGKSK
jgi:hypothetical protein